MFFLRAEVQHEEKELLPKQCGEPCNHQCTSCSYKLIHLYLFFSF